MAMMFMSQIHIDEKEREFLVGTNVNFAASLEVEKSEKIILDLDKKGVLNSTPTVYEFINGNLKELGEMMTSGSISKSGVNHRLRKLNEMADKLRTGEPIELK